MKNIFSKINKELVRTQKSSVLGIDHAQAKFVSGPARTLAGGFTLVEMMVAVSIFAIIVTVGIGALFNMNESYSYSRAQQAVMDQLNFAMESMMREIRTGTQYHCGATTPQSGPQNCGFVGANSIDFINSDGNHMTYRLSASQQIQLSRSGGTYSDITPPEIQITDLNFRVFGSEGAPERTQPLTVITITGVNTVRDQDIDFVMQTSVSQRLPDLSS